MDDPHKVKDDYWSSRAWCNAHRPYPNGDSPYPIIKIRILTDDVNWMHNNQWPYDRGVARDKVIEVGQVKEGLFLYHLKYHGLIQIRLDPRQYEVVE